MAETVDSEIGEIERIINEYKQGISRAIEEEKDRFEELSHVLAKSQHEAERLIVEARQQAHRISENIIAQAEQKAQQIVNEAEELVKNEAKKKTQKEEERIKKAAKDKAVKLIAKARQISEKIANSIIAESRQEADKLVKQLTEKARKEAEQEAQDIRKKAHVEAKQITSDTRNAAKEDGEKELAIIITAAKKVAEQIVREAKEKVKIQEDQSTTNSLSSAERTESESFSNPPEPRNIAEETAADIEDKSQTELEDSTPEITEAQQRLAKVFEAAINELEETGGENGEIPVPNASQKENEYPATSKIEFETSEVTEREDAINEYIGKLELHIMPPVDLGQLSKFEKQLLHVPNLQILGKGGSANGIIWFEINYSEPLPVENLLQQISPVKEIAKHGNYLTISLNDR